MPQMMPMNWMIMMTTFTMLIMLIMKTTFFMISYKPNNKNIYKNNNWKW